MPYLLATSLTESTLSLYTLVGYVVDNLLIVGVSILHGPHHGAQKSISTAFLSESLIILSNSCIVVMSIINVGEVLYIVERERGLKKAHEVLAGLKQLSIEILPASQDAVFAAAHIKANFRISYADAFVVAAAQERQGIVYTGAPEFKEVENIIQVQWI